MNSKRTFFMAPIFLALILACALPGLPTSSTSLPTLTADTGAVETMVAGTVSVAIAQTQQSAPSQAPATAVIVASPATPTLTSMPTATVTSTSISTITATSTPTITVTSTSTATPTPTRNPSQSMLTKQQDGSILFIDELAYYKIKLPWGWLAVRVNEKEYLDAFSLQEAANTHVQQALLGVQNESPNLLRLYAINPTRIQNEFVSDMRFVLDEGTDISLNTDEELWAIAGKISTSVTVFRFEVTSVEMATSASGVDFGIIEAKSSFTDAAGVDVPIYQKQVFFNVPAGTQSITLTTVDNLKETFLPAFDAMLETIEIISEE